MDKHKIEKERGVVFIKQTTKLNIVFHNPNAPEVFIKELIMVVAEVAKTTVEQKILHSQEKSEEIVV